MWEVPGLKLALECLDGHTLGKLQPNLHHVRSVGWEWLVEIELGTVRKKIGNNRMIGSAWACLIAVTLVVASALGWAEKKVILPICSYSFECYRHLQHHAVVVLTLNICLSTWYLQFSFHRHFINLVIQNYRWLASLHCGGEHFQNIYSATKTNKKSLVHNNFFTLQGSE